jgi:hypothetical protein
MRNLRGSRAPVLSLDRVERTARPDVRGKAALVRMGVRPLATGRALASEALSNGRH